jgi:UDP-glucose 4-epimerase
LNPISPYAESKVKAEEVCMRFREDYGLKTTIVRPFNVYGPRQRNDQYAGVIEKFIENLRGAKTLVIYGDGSQTRDFIYVADAVNAFILASKSDRAVGEIFNVATGQPTSINSLAQLMIEISGVKGVMLQHADAREGDIKHSYANIERARSLLLFEPKVQLKEGLSKLLRLKGLSKG